VLQDSAPQTIFSRVPLSQYRTTTRTTVTVQNKYTYHCHNSKHVHTPLSQYRTTHTTLTIQNNYKYHCHNTKYAHLPLSQYKTCTLNTVTKQNMYTYHCHNKRHVHMCLCGIAQSVQGLATGWTVRGSNPFGGEIFRTLPDRPWGLPSLLHNGFSGLSRGQSGRGVELTTHTL
jgi:hypothetical protein